MDSTEVLLQVWHNAYEFFVGADYAIMWDYLREQVRNGNVSYADAETIAEDVVATFNL